MNTNTTLGKGVKVLLWAIVSNAVIAGLSVILNNPDLYNPTIVNIANVVLVIAKNWADPNVKNV